MKALVLLISLLVFAACGCRSASSIAPVTVYGQAGPGKIAVFINGDVERPGDYFVDEGATLASISDLFGGFRACATCGFAPSQVVVFSQGTLEARHRYLLSRTNDLQAVRLQNGDRINYATIHF